jgi:hypothetical protein
VRKWAVRERRSDENVLPDMRAHMKYCVAQSAAFTNLPRGSIGRLQDVVARGTLVAKHAFVRRLNAVAGLPQDFRMDFDDRYCSLAPYYC